MHIILKDPITNEIVGVLCIERHASSCIVLQSDIDRLEELVSIARAHKVPEVRVVVPEEGVVELEAFGWKRSDNQVVMVRKSA